MPEKVPISGGPHTGKTTLMEALQQRFPDAYFVPEPATNVISRELALQEKDKDYVPRVPWLDYSAFGPLVAEESEVLEAAIPSQANVVFQDRSLIDTVAYSHISGFETFVPSVWRKVAMARYSFALICQPIGSYMATEVRRETAEEALHTHEAIEEAYRESGLDVVTLPLVSVNDRVSLVEAALQSRGLI